MADAVWMSYVGMATGVVGAITGIAGAVMGYVSYRKIDGIKTLDLRLELRRAANDTRASLSALERLLEYSNRSRKAVASATGRFRSGMMQKWSEEYASDNTLVAGIQVSVPDLDENYDQLTHQELEQKLVAVHSLQNQIKSLSDKYNAAVVSDDEDRRQIKEDIRGRH